MTITAPRILIKRAIVQALQSFSAAQPEYMRFDVRQDFMGQLPAEAWQKQARLVNVFLESFTNAGSYTDTQESVTFNIVCAVCPDALNYTQGVDGLNFLLDQVRAAIWGDGDAIGLRNHLPDGINIAIINAFNATIGSSITDEKEQLIVYAETDLEITHNITEYTDFMLRRGQSVQFKGDYKI